MARTPGSKNRATILKELQALGRTDDFSEWSYLQLRDELQREKTHRQNASPSPPPLPPVIERLVISPELAKSIVASARSRFDELIDEYAPGRVDTRGRPVGVPERIQDTLRKVFYSESESAARGLAQKAYDSLFMYLLGLWSSKVITGPDTVANLKTRADKAESLAELLENKGKFEEATKQRERAASIRASMARKQQT